MTLPVKTMWLSSSVYIHQLSSICFPDTCIADYTQSLRVFSFNQPLCQFDHSFISLSSVLFLQTRNVYSCYKIETSSGAFHISSIRFEIKNMLWHLINLEKKMVLLEKSFTAKLSHNPLPDSIWLTLFCSKKYQRYNHVNRINYQPNRLPPVPDVKTDCDSDLTYTELLKCRFRRDEAL